MPKLTDLERRVLQAIAHRRDPYGGGGQFSSPHSGIITRTIGRLERRGLVRFHLTGAPAPYVETDAEKAVLG